MCTKKLIMTCGGVLLAGVVTLAACKSGEAVGLTPDIDDEAVAKVQADMPTWIEARSRTVLPSSGLPQPPVEILGYGPDPDEDEAWIRRYASGGTSMFGHASPVVLNEAEIDLLLERMRSAKD